MNQDTLDEYFGLIQREVQGVTTDKQSPTWRDIEKRTGRKRSSLRQALSQKRSQDPTINIYSIPTDVPKKHGWIVREAIYPEDHEKIVSYFSRVVQAFNKKIDKHTEIARELRRRGITKPAE